MADSILPCSIYGIDVELLDFIVQFISCYFTGVHALSAVAK